MKPRNMFRVGIPPTQPLFPIFCLDFFLDYYYYYVFLEKRLWWWDYNPEHVYDFHEQDDIKF